MTAFVSDGADRTRDGSRSGLMHQLEYEGFTAEQAAYGVSQAGLKALDERTNLVGRLGAGPSGTDA